MVLLYGKSCVLNLLAFLAFSATTAVVVVQDGGYQNTLVTFSPDVEKKDQVKILLATKDLLTLTSSFVYKATGIHFGEVVFLLPYTWGKLEDWSRDNVTSDSWSNCKVATFSSDEIYYKANIFVEHSSDSVYGTNPFTLQSGGCGSEGVRISIPKDFLINENNEDTNTKAKLMAREWIRYRYGVFYENGYPNDDRFPLYYRPPGSNDPEDIRITGCTNIPVKYSFNFPDGNTCSLEVDKSGRPGRDSTSCSIHLEKGSNNNVVSSLMYLQDLPNVVNFCDDSNHNADVPSKQNVLCKGRSIWSVMKEHPDFRGRKEPEQSATSSPPQPTFMLAVDTNPRIVLAVDKSKSITKITRRVTLKAVQKFLYDIPDETEFALLRFSSETEAKIRFGPLYERELGPFTFADGPSSPTNAVKTALQDLTDDKTGKRGTIVILSSSSATTSKEDFVNLQGTSEICLVLVILDGSNASGEGFEELLDAFKCSYLRIMPPPVEKIDALDVLKKLNEEFGHVMELHSYHNAKRTVGTQIMNRDLVSFEIDRSVKQFQISLASTEESMDNAFEESHVVLRNGMGEKIKVHKVDNRKGFRVYEVSNNQDNRFNFRIEQIDEDILPILLEVVVQESNTESIRVRTWIKDTTVKEGSSNPGQMPIVLYTEVTMGINPILEAKVKASITMPDNSTDELDLFDNGLGDPDVTKYDGIYTRYFTQFPSEGDYHVTIAISDNDGKSQTAQHPDTGPTVPCCGSAVPTGKKQNTGPFKRVIYTNFRAVSGRPLDGYKPSTVQDLRLSSLDDPRKVSLSFTAPGNEMDQGTAEKYIFKLFKTREDAQIFEQKNEITNASKISELVPEEYPSEQTVVIELSENLATNTTYFIAMRSESKSGKQSDTSNTVQVFIPASISPSPSPTNDGINIDDDDGKHINESKSAGANGKIIGIVVGVCILVIIILICAYIAFYLLVVRPKKKASEEERSVTPSTKNKDTDEDVGDGTVPAKEWQMERNNSISPINSWPSEVLVSHHEKVKEAKRKNEKPPVFKMENLENSPDVICTISNGMLPNPIYSSHADDLNESDDHDQARMPIPLQQQNHFEEDQAATTRTRKVSHV